MKFILASILLIAAILRFWQLGANPPSLTWDEVAWGYNAYALGIDGKDEFGRFLPLDYIESFGDFKPPMYVYLAVVPVKLFGLNEFAVRFPSAFFGVLTVLVTYFLVKRIFEKLGATQIIKQDKIALLSAFFLAISPWHINLSRAAFEANVATFFLVAGVWLFLAWVRGKRWCLVLSVISFVASMYTFNTARVVGPLLIVVLSFGFIKEFFRRKKEVIAALIAGCIVLLPLLPFFFTPQASLRFQEVNIFSNIGIIDLTNQQIANDHNAFFSRIIHNRRLAFGIEYLRHYFDHFNLNFLFIRGDGNPKFSTQDLGQLYLWDLPFFIAGVLFLLRTRMGYWWLIFLWLFLGIVPAATARETPHALRIEATLPTYQVLVAFGIATVFTWLKTWKYVRFKKVVMSGIILLLFLNIAYYLHGYYLHFPREYSGEWQYGYKEAIAYTESVKDRFDVIYMTTNLGRPHIYLAFYSKMDPNVYRSQSVVTREVFGFVHVEQVGKYRFAKELTVSEEDKGKRVLFVDVPSGVSENAHVLETFSLLNGNAALVAYTRDRL